MQERTVRWMSLALFALLVAWGLYTLVYYLGVPYHGAALLGARYDALAEGYASDAILTRGLAILWSAFTVVLGRASPLTWYAGIWLLLWALYAGWRWTQTNSTTIATTWRPWHIAALFVFSVWLFSTVLGYGTVGGRPVRLYAEPTVNTYNVSENSLSVLQADYQSMLRRGCLSNPIGQTQTGEQLHNLRFWCMQQAFVTRVLSQILFIAILLLEFLALGRAILRLAKIRPQNPAAETLLSVTFGACGWIVILWCLAIAGIYTATVGWIAAAVVGAACYRHVRYWIEQCLKHSWTMETKPWDAVILLGWLMMSYLALNFLEVVRPFPIGWDDLGSYLNRPRLLVSYGHFIYSMSPFDWTYLTSLGFLLFGYGSTFGSTASMMVNWSAGLLATFAVFVFARTFLGTRRGLLSALLYYTLPLVGHFSFADMKVDNAVFLFGAVAMFLVFLGLFREHDAKERKMPLLFAGIAAGFAFATKGTAIMVAFPLIAIIVGSMLGAPAFIGGVFLTLAAFAQQQILSLTDIAQRMTGTEGFESLNTYFFLTCLLLSLACFAYAAMRKRSQLVPAALLTGLFIAGFAGSMYPWIQHNTLERGQFIPSRLELSSPNNISEPVSIDDLPPELAVPPKGDSPAVTGGKEELDRYWGFDHGWKHYLTLPWRVVMNIDATGYYVTTIPALLLFPLLLLLPFFWKPEGRWLRWLFVGTLLMLAEWMFLANGIPWYGIGVFLGLAIGLEALVALGPDRRSRIAAGIFVGCSLFIACGMRIWQLEQQRNIFEYSMGKVSADVLRTVTIPWYDIVSETVVDRYNQMPDRPHLYRIGTFIPYFIPRNLEVIGVNDHQLDLFNRLYQERDAALTTERLKALGFNSIIFDTNTATIEKDENGSLHQKVSAFVDYVNNPAAGLNVVISDPAGGLAFILIP